MAEIRREKQLRLVVYPCLSHYFRGFSTIPGGARFRPSTVVIQLAVGELPGSCSIGGVFCNFLWLEKNRGSFFNSGPPKHLGSDFADIEIPYKWLIWQTNYLVHLVNVVLAGKGWTFPRFECLPHNWEIFQCHISFKGCMLKYTSMMSSYSPLPNYDLTFSSLVERFFQLCWNSWWILHRSTL